jgi:hypothetical protein
MPFKTVTDGIFEVGFLPDPTDVGGVPDGTRRRTSWTVWVRDTRGGGPEPADLRCGARIPHEK